MGISGIAVRLTMIVSVGLTVTSSKAVPDQSVPGVNVDTELLPYIFVLIGSMLRDSSAEGLITLVATVNKLLSTAVVSIIMSTEVSEILIEGWTCVVNEAFTT